MSARESFMTSSALVDGKKVTLPRGVREILNLLGSRAGAGTRVTWHLITIDGRVEVVLRNPNSTPTPSAAPMSPMASQALSSLRAVTPR